MQYHSTFANGAFCFQLGLEPLVAVVALAEQIQALPLLSLHRPFAGRQTWVLTSLLLQCLQMGLALPALALRLVSSEDFPQSLRSLPSLPQLYIYIPLSELPLLVHRWACDAFSFAFYVGMPFVLLLMQPKGWRLLEPKWLHVKFA